MSLLDWFADRRKTAPALRPTPEPDEGDGLWSKCPECGEVVYRKDLIANASVCASCGYHHRIHSEERLRILLDPGSFIPLDGELSPTDPLAFKDRRAPTPIGSVTANAKQACATPWSVAPAPSKAKALRWPSWISVLWAEAWLSLIHI